MTTQQLGTLIRKARGKRSIREVARTSGLHREQIKGIEAGRTAYTMPVFLRLCEAMGGWGKVFGDGG